MRFTSGVKDQDIREGMGFWAQISMGDKGMNPFSLTPEGRRGVDKGKCKCRGGERETEGIQA